MRFAKAFIGTQVLSDAPQTEGLQVCGSKKAFAPVGAFFPKAFFFAEKKAFAPVGAFFPKAFFFAEKKAFAPVGAFFPKAFFFAEKKAFACAAPAVALRSLAGRWREQGLLPGRQLPGLY